MGRAYHSVRATSRSGYIPLLVRRGRGRGRSSFGTFLWRKVSMLLSGKKKLDILKSATNSHAD